MPFYEEVKKTKKKESNTNDDFIEGVDDLDDNTRSQLPSQEHCMWLVNIIKIHATKIAKGMIQDQVNNQLNQLRNDIQSLTGKVQAISDKIETLQSADLKNRRKVEQLQYDNADIRSKVRDADIKADAIQQQQYQNNIQIVGMPETKDTDEVKQLIKLGKDKMGIKLKTSDIKEVTRLGKNDSSTPRKVIVRFQNKTAKEKFCEHKKKLTPHKDPKKNIYLNDHLTKHRQNLLYAGRQLVKSRKLFAAWSQNGNVLIRKTESSKITQVSDHSDLMKIKEDDSDSDKSRSSVGCGTIVSHLSDYDFEYDSDL